MALTTQTSTCPRLASTVSFAPQQTQNTALVVEHRCLYTHDLRRKAKRWQDGFLRFHTFNKRIMIYDIPRNYIGDTHWREEDPVQDGDEFELDRPVLVQVGEQSGSVEQDLTGLLEERHKKDYKIDQRMDSHDSSLQALITENGPRTGSAFPTQLRPKTLNALLGTPKGTLGRASLPIQSPYEVRRAAKDVARNMEPPAKRRRVGVPAACMQPPVIKEPRAGPAFQGQSRNKHAENLGRVNQSSILDMPQGDEQSIAVAEHRTKTGRAASKSDSKAPLNDLESSSRRECDYGKREGPKAAKRIELDSKVRTKTIKHRKLEARSLSLNAQETPETLAQTQSSEPPAATKALSDSGMNTNRSNEQTEAGSKLRLLSHKPRRKLIYMDLLPQIMPAVGKTISSNNVSNLVKSKSKNRNIQSSDLSKWHHNEQDHLEARPRRSDAKPEQISSKLDWSPNRRGNATSPSKRASGMEQAKGIIRGGRLPPLGTIEPIIAKANSTVCGTNLARATMDEILLSCSRPQSSTRLVDLQIGDDSLPIQRCFPSSVEPIRNAPTRQDQDPARSVQSPPCQSTTQLPSSQPCGIPDAFPPTAQQFHPSKEGKETPENLPVVASPKKTPWDRSGDVGFTQMGPLPTLVSPEPKSSGTIAPHGTLPAAANSTSPISVSTPTPLETSSVAPGAVHSLGLPTLPLLETRTTLLESAALRNTLGRVSSNDPKVSKVVTSLPPFKPLCPTGAKEHSPFRKSLSDTSALVGAREVPGTGHRATMASDANCVKEQLTSPWSKEAWDLFGCGRDGKIVDFRTFCLNERA